MKKTMIFLILQCSMIVNGQVMFNNTYSKPNFDYGDAVIERYDGKYLVAGASRSQFVSDFDVNILLIDSIGNLIWDKYIGLSPGMEFAYSLIETSDSNYVVVGKNNCSPYLLKFNSSGDIIWEKEYSSPLCTSGHSVGETKSNGYYFIRPDTNITLFVTNSFGDTLWAKPYEFANFEAVTQTSDSGFAMTGSTTTWIGDMDVILSKTDKWGDTLWTKKFGGEGNDFATSVQQLSDSGYVVAGNFDTQIADDELATFIIRTNSIGDTLWTRKYYIGNSHYIKECRNNGGYILSTKRFITGWFQDPDEYYLLITKIDTLGNIQWSREFDGYSYSLGNNITQTSDGGFLLTGYINNGSALSDIILIKLDSVGNFVLSLNNNFETAHNRVSVFPVPAKDEINFVLNNTINEKITEIRMFNQFGQEVHSITGLQETLYKYSVKDISYGVYFYMISTDINQSYTGKFIIEK